jgi:cell wall-associated NlpC family hydrolase
MNNRRVLVVGGLGCASVLFISLMVVPIFFGASQFLFGGGGGGLGGCTDTSQAGVQPVAANDAKSIPADYLTLYKRAGQDYGLPWNLLAGIGKVETDHGRDPHTGVKSGENYAGAGGPMQFLQATWNTFGVDGNKDKKKDRYNPADAIPSAAAYLKHNGAPTRTRTAIFQYNHSWGYVDLVLSWAKRYATGGFTAVQADGAICSDNSALGHVANAIVAKAIQFAMAQRGKPYVWGAPGPDSFDCSGLVQAAYRAVGVSIPRTTFDQWPFGVKIGKGKEQPGDLVFFNSGPNSGPGHPGHVGMVIGGGKMVVARCTACSPAIGVFPYNRSDLAGFTRPLANPSAQKQLAQG